MDPVTLGIITSVASGYFAKYSSKVVEQLFEFVMDNDPGFESRLRTANSTQDYESLFRDAVGVIDAQAGDGAIDVDGSLLEAIRGIRFNHERGSVTISDSTIQAPVLITGGGQGATGQTRVSGGTELNSQGTSINVGKGAEIRITGNAQIRQN